MAISENPLQPVSPANVLREIADAVPKDCHKFMIIIGSLAVGYHYFGSRSEMVVRTKDADCLLSPRGVAVPAGIAIIERLIDDGWKIRGEGGWGEPGDQSTPDDMLPAVRLRPPGISDWFIELLTVPATPDDVGKRWVRIETELGHFGLRSFRFLSLTDYLPILTEMGIFVSRPEMMALANLLEHPEIEANTMSAGFAGRLDIKRSNKDLGRVIAISWLATDRDEDALLSWVEMWEEALKNRFPDEWVQLAGRTGSGLRELLESAEDLDQAYHTCANGLLASKALTIDEFKIAGERLLIDAVEPIEKLI